MKIKLEGSGKSGKDLVYEIYGINSRLLYICFYTGLLHSKKSLSWDGNNSKYVYIITERDDDGNLVVINIIEKKHLRLISRYVQVEMNPIIRAFLKLKEKIKKGN